MKSTMASLPFSSKSSMASLSSATPNLLGSSSSLLNGSSLRSKYLPATNGIGSLQSKFMSPGLNSNLELQALKAKLGLDSLTNKYQTPATRLDALKSKYQSPSISGLGLDLALKSKY